LSISKLAVINYDCLLDVLKIYQIINNNNQQQGGEEETKGSEPVGTTNTSLRRPMFMGHCFFMFMLPMVFFFIIAISEMRARITS
jgi:hypothetical protein